MKPTSALAPELEATPHTQRVAVLRLVARLPDGREIELQANTVDLSDRMMASYAIRGHGEGLVHMSERHAETLLAEADREGA